MPSWRRDFASGPVALVSLTVIPCIPAFSYNGTTSTPYAVTVLSTDGAVTPLSEALGFIISIIIFLLLVLSVGYLIRTVASRLLESGFDAAVNRAPPVWIVYNASKLVVEAVLTSTEDFQKPVHLETRPGIRMTVFKTGKTTEDGKVVVFMSAAPNTTTGFVMEVDPEGIKKTGEKIEEAFTRVFSAEFTE